MARPIGANSTTALHPQFNAVMAQKMGFVPETVVGEIAQNRKHTGGPKAGHNLSKTVAEHLAKGRGAIQGNLCLLQGPLAEGALQGNRIEVSGAKLALQSMGQHGTEICGAGMDRRKDLMDLETKGSGQLGIQTLIHHVELELLVA